MQNLFAVNEPFETFRRRKLFGGITQYVTVLLADLDVRAFCLEMSPLAQLYCTLFSYRHFLKLLYILNVVYRVYDLIINK